MHINLRLFGLVVLLGLLVGIIALMNGAPVVIGEDLTGVTLAGELVLQQGMDGYTGCADTEISRLNADVNYGTEAGFSVRALDSKSALVRFDLKAASGAPPLPQGATITGAWLDLYAVQRGFPERVLNACVYEVIRPWDSGQATWKHARTGEPWEEAGCNDVFWDRHMFPLLCKNVGEEGIWYSFDVTSLVQKWYADGATNYGVIIKDLSTTTTERRFASSEHMIQGWRPALRVRYQRPTFTPAPTVTSSPSITPTPTVTSSPSITPSTPSVTPSITPTPCPVRLSLVMKNFRWPTPTPSPPAMCLAYDDGTDEFGAIPGGSGRWLAVRFTVDQPSQVVSLGFHIRGRRASMRIAVYEGYVGTDSLKYQVDTYSPEYMSSDWWWWNIAAENVRVAAGEIYVVLEWLEAPDEHGFCLRLDANSALQRRSYLGPPLTEYVGGNLMIRACFDSDGIVESP